MKVWLHRVNSVERAVRMAKQYRGMEIDVMYDSAADAFDVGHPPAPSIGLSLDRLLAAVPDVAEPLFLDRLQEPDRRQRPGRPAPGWWRSRGSTTSSAT